MIWDLSNKIQDFSCDWRSHIGAVAMRCECPVSIREQSWQVTELPGARWTFAALLLKQQMHAHPTRSGCREMLPRAKEQPPDPPDAPAGAGAAAPGAAGALAAASASAKAGLPQGSLHNNAHVGDASARLHADREDTHASAAGDSAGVGGSGSGAGSEPGLGVGPAEGTYAGAERPGGALAARSGSGPGLGSPGDAPAPAEESFRRIRLEATAPGAGLAGEERALFYGGALTRAKRDTGGVGAS